MTKYAFLSHEWIDAASSLRDAAPTSEPARIEITMNLVVEEVPFATEPLEACLDTVGGVTRIGLGHLDDAEVKVSLSYGVARSFLVDNNTEAAIQAFMEGKIRVEGDISKLLAFESAPLTDKERAVADQIRAITE